MAIEEDSREGVEVAQPWEASTQLIDYKGVGREVIEFGSEICP